jgi:hypothetical protein
LLAIASTELAGLIPGENPLFGHLVGPIWKSGRLFPEKT